MTCASWRFLSPYSVVDQWQYAGDGYSLPEPTRDEPGQAR